MSYHQQLHAQAQAQMRVHLPQTQQHTNMQRALILQRLQQRQQQIQQQQQQQQQQKTSFTNSQSLTNDPIFLSLRSPFFETVSRHCVMPIHQQQLIQFQFNLPSNFVRDIQQTLHTPKSNHKQNNPSLVPKELHIRLFDMNLKKHEPWDKQYWNIIINGRIVNIDEMLNKKPVVDNPAKKKKKKSKGFSYVQPLNISVYAQPVMTFRIACKRNQFMGAAAIEIEKLISIDTISDRICRRSELAFNAHLLEQQQQQQQQNAPSKTIVPVNDRKEGEKPNPKHPEKHKCKICHKTENLSRCSRCKSIWYCSREHQAHDWSTHHHICLPFSKLKDLHFLSDTKTIANAKTKGNTNNNSTSTKDITDDVICSETRISLKDPLSLCRIQTPVRGVNCLHPQCMDLNTFLRFSKNCRLWQCPTCMKALQSNLLLIDYNMKHILEETDENIDVVRLFPNQSYKIITLEELENEEEVRQNSLIDRKRKRNENENGRMGNVKRKKYSMNGGCKSGSGNGDGNVSEVGSAGGTNRSGSNSVSESAGNTISTAIVLD